MVHNKRSRKCIAYLGRRENIWGAVKREEGAEFHWCAFSPNIASGCSCSRILEPTWSLSTNPVGSRPLLPPIKMQRWKIFSGLSSGSPAHSLHLQDWGRPNVMMSGFLYFERWAYCIRLSLSCHVGQPQGFIFRLTCSDSELTKDHVLTSASVKIFRTVTRNAVNKSVWRKKDCSWLPWNKHATNIWLSSLRIRADLSWRTGKHLHVLHVLRTYSTCGYPGY